LLFIALGAGALTATLFSYSVPRLGPSSYAIIANCELITVVLIGVLALGEDLSAERAIGGTLVACGILVHGFCRRRPEG
jgi:drug/metabolite transporter (DMT)-like permease